MKSNRQVSKTARNWFPFRSKSADESSIAKCEEILKDDPYDKETWMKLGCLYHKKFLFGKAIENKLKAASIGPNDPEVQFSLGCSYCAKGDFYEAIKCYSEALRLKPDYIEACEALGEQYQMTGQPVKADEWLFKAEKLKYEKTEKLSSSNF